jgi:hypothetical protein
MLALYVKWRTLCPCRQRPNDWAALLKHFMLTALEVAESLGVRVLLIHAKDDEAKNFYSHFGFVESPLDPLVMMMLLTELRLAIRRGTSVLLPTAAST